MGGLEFPPLALDLKDSPKLPNFIVRLPTQYILIRPVHVMKKVQPRAFRWYFEAARAVFTAYA